MEKENYKKLSIECAFCKSKFDIWIDMANFDSEVETKIRENFYHYCPVCKALKELEEQKKK